MNYIEEYYSNYDEEGRLLSNHGQVEYRTTMKYIHETAERIGAKKILEVGAGTVNNPGAVSLLSGLRKPQIRF